MKRLVMAVVHIICAERKLNTIHLLWPGKITEEHFTALQCYWSILLGMYWRWRSRVARRFCIVERNMFFRYHKFWALPKCSVFLSAPLLLQPFHTDTHGRFEKQRSRKKFGTSNSNLTLSPGAVGIWTWHARFDKQNFNIVIIALRSGEVEDLKFQHDIDTGRSWYFNMTWFSERGGMAVPCECKLYVDMLSAQHIRMTSFCSFFCRKNHDMLTLATTEMIGPCKFSHGRYINNCCKKPQESLWCA